MPQARPAPLVCIGAMHLDTICHAADAIRAETSTPAHMSTRPGGVATNVARSVRKLGLKTSLIGAVGSDGAATSLAARLKADGIDLALADRADYLTGQYIALHNPDGSLAAACVDDRILSEAAPHLFQDQITRLKETQPDALWFVDANLPADMLEAVTAGLDPSRTIANAVSEAKAPRLRPVVSRLSCLMLNRGEAIALTRLADTTSSETLMKALRGMGARQVVLTEGASGVLVHDGKTMARFDALKTGVVDVTGAGDALAAGIIAALARGYRLMEALPVGLKAAALTLGSTGALADTLTWEAVARP